LNVICTERVTPGEIFTGFDSKDNLIPAGSVLLSETDSLLVSEVVAGAMLTLG
jgi:hypothetical protein